MGIKEEKKKKKIDIFLQNCVLSILIYYDSILCFSFNKISKVKAIAKP